MSESCSIWDARRTRLRVICLRVRQRSGQTFMFADPVASSRNLGPGTVQHKKPQSKQTKDLGDNKIPGLSTFLSPLKWIIISTGNSH
jgi:hypothetical protein